MNFTLNENSEIPQVFLELVLLTPECFNFIFLVLGLYEMYNGIEIQHPLYATHQGFIRSKMLTPILAGRPPPAYPGPKPTENDMELLRWYKESDYFAKYIIDMMVPWTDAGNNIPRNLTLSTLVIQTIIVKKMLIFSSSSE